MSKIDDLIGNTADIIIAMNQVRSMAKRLRKDLESEANAVGPDEGHLRWFIRSGPMLKVDTTIGLLEQVEKLLRSAQDDIRKLDGTE
jgi:hypothetical protein